MSVALYIPLGAVNGSCVTVIVREVPVESVIITFPVRGAASEFFPTVRATVTVASLAGSEYDERVIHGSHAAVQLQFDFTVNFCVSPSGMTEMESGDTVNDSSTAFLSGAQDAQMTADTASESVKNKSESFMSSEFMVSLSLLRIEPV